MQRITRVRKTRNERINKIVRTASITTPLSYPSHDSEYGTVKTRGCNENRVRQAQGPITYEYHCQAENLKLKRETVES